MRYEAPESLDTAMALLVGAKGDARGRAPDPEEGAAGPDSEMFIISQIAAG